MTERSIVDAAARLRKSCEPYLVATVISAPHPGARMLLTRFRWLASSASGGCLDGDWARKAWWRTRDGQALLLSYEAGELEEDELRAAFGLDGIGAVDVLIERAGIAGRIDTLEVAERCRSGQRRGAVATIVRATSLRVGARLALIAGAAAVEEEADALPAELREPIAGDLRAAIETGASSVESYGDVDVLVEAIVPPPRLFLFATGHDVIPIATLAKTVGWDVVVCASEPRHAMRERFALVDEIVVAADPATVAARIAAADRAVAVVAHHDGQRDRACAAALLAIPAVRYVALLGDPGELRDARLHVATGATAPELALSLVADIHAALRGPARRPRPSERPSQQLAAVS